LRTLHRAIRRPDKSGIPIEHSLRSLSVSGIEIRRSELTMVAADPGQGKSSFALEIARTCGLPTLYVSADTNMRTQSIRLLSMTTGMHQDAMDLAMDAQRDWCEQQLKQSGHIRWVFDSSPALEEINDEVEAFIEMHGEPPGLLVVDNASDVPMDNVGDEWATLRELMRSLKWLARHHNTAVLALHHTSEAIHGNPCPPRYAVQGKVSQVPALILTLASTQGWMAVCPVKNRSGWADPSGARVVMLDWDPVRMFLADSHEGQVLT
jgi:hypothetical protein